MKIFLQIVSFIIIVIAGFWVGMQWGSLENSNIPPVDYQHITTPEPKTVPPVDTIVPPPQTAATTSEPAKAETPSVSTQPETPIVPPPTPTSTSENKTVDIPLSKNGKITHYQSSYFKYGFDVPANVYYAAFGGADGAIHTVGIAKEDPATLADAPVRVYFYGKKILPELKNISGNTFIDPAGKFIYVLVDGQYSFKIAANDVNNPIVQKIVQTLAVES